MNALCQQIKNENYQFNTIEEIVLDQNNLRDEQFASILRALIIQSHKLGSVVHSVTYSNNQFGK